MTQAVAKSTTQAVMPRHSLVAEMATKYGLEPEKFIAVLRGTYFKTTEPTPLTNEEIAAGLVVANKYGLDPFLREIHVTRAKGRLLVMTGIDGWIRIAQRNPNFDGMEFQEAFDDQGNIESVRCTIYRKDNGHPTVITAYMEEYRRDTEPWRAMPIRMLRHKAAKEAIRYAFGVSGIDDEEPDELETGPYVRTRRSLNLGGTQMPEEPPPANEPFKAPEPAREPGQDG